MYKNAPGDVIKVPNVTLMKNTVPGNDAIHKADNVNGLPPFHP